MDGNKKVSFRCIAKHIRDGTILTEIESTEDKTLVLKGYRNKIRGNYMIPGPMKFFFSSGSGKSKTKGREITDLFVQLGNVVGNGGVLFVDYDPDISIAGGGFAEGAEVWRIPGAAAAGPLIAQGGLGGGGEKDDKGNTTGGPGIGGDGGPGAMGRGGKGTGGGANVGADNPKGKATAGPGYGGQV